ncbi:Detected protein of unknown function [Hibiscus syriacus]|uniref:DUF7081 domain-containing protein n=1 Tax=Hibiscus syriacus TaxID=106335 RepID=A0A6A3BNI5_HIBSY|nr:Detected protein of unknown function [Hibiscus syriacus]
MASIPTPPHTDDNPSDVSSPHIDIHQDLFPDYYGGTASAPSAPKDEFLGNDIDNGSDKDIPGNDVDNGTPVPPGSSGEGLPYAPAHWPNAGDIWTWRVGKRVSASGFFNDRFLSVPESLKKANVPKVFTSKPVLERFIRSNFPDADIDAFFASFVWKIPAIVEPSTKAVTPSATAEEVEDDKKKPTK